MLRSKRFAIAVLLGALLGLAPWAVIAAQERTVTDSATGPPRASRAVAVPVPLGLLDPGLHHVGNTIMIPAPDVDVLRAEDAQRDGPARVGVVVELELRTTSHGEWIRLDDGAWLWTTSLVAPGAKRVRVRLAAWSPPRDAELLLYNPLFPERVVSVSLQATGRATRRGGAHVAASVPGEEVRIEYRLPPGSRSRAGADELLISGLVYVYDDTVENISDSTEPLPCHLDVSCYAAWAQEKTSVARVSYLSESDLLTCSGAMLNRVPADFTPIFMTAHHCEIDSQSSAETLWRFETNSCNGTVPSESLLPRSSVQISLADQFQTDFRLLGLSFDAPNDTLYAGYDAAYWANSSSGTGIHHPKASHKRIAFGTKVGDETSPSNRKAWHIRYDQDQGLVERGSSGSPIFDASHRVRGVDSFFYDTQPASCTGANHEYYGRLDLAWSFLWPFLNPTDPVYVDGSFSGTPEGTPGKPFVRVLAGAYAVIEDSHVYIEAGTYDESFVMEKAMVLHALNGEVIIGSSSP